MMDYLRYNMIECFCCGPYQTNVWLYIEEKTKELELHFKKLGKEVEVIWCDSSEIESSACASEDFFVVDGQV